MWLTSLSIRRPLLIVMAVLAIMLGGLFAYRSMAVDLLPTLSIPYISVNVGYPGAGPREVESRVTRPLENALAGVPGVKTVRSTSGDGYSSVMLEFRDGTDPDRAAQDVERKVSQVAPGFPDGVRSPSVSKFSLDDQPIMVAGITWDRNPEGTYRLVDDVVRPRLEAIEGVASVQVFGGQEREITVSVDRTKLEARGLSLAQVNSALSAANLSMPGGYVEEGTNEYSVRVYGLYQELSQLERLVVSSAATGGPVRLMDVATLQDGFKKQRVISRVDGAEGVALLIQKQQMANTVNVSERVIKTLKELEPTLPPGVKSSVVIDNGVFVKKSVEGVTGSLRDAVLIVAFVLLLFLHTWRSTLIVLISIPTSIIATFGVMWAMGFSLNMMTMLGLSLTVGILVDDSIVILENIYRHMKKGENPWTAAVNGRAEIGAAAVAITLVDVVVYAPLAFSTGMTAQYFKQFSGAVVVATLFSLLVSFTLTPMLASRWLTAFDEERSPLAPVWRVWEAGYMALERGYRRLLGGALKLRYLVLFVGFLTFVGGIALVAMGAVGSEFITESDEGVFTVKVEMPAGTTVQASNTAVGQLEKQIAALPEVEAFLTVVQPRSTQIYVDLKPLKERKRGIKVVSADVRRMITEIPGMKGQVALASMGGGGGGQAIMAQVRGSDMAELTKLADQVEAILRKTDGTIDVVNNAAKGTPEMRIEIDHQQLADLGLTTAQVGSAIRTALDGTVATELRRENEDKVDIRVRYAGTEAGSELTAIPDIPLTTAQGTRVKLSQVARLVPVDGPSEIARTDRVRQVVVGANLSGSRPLGDITADLKQGIKGLTVPAGYKVVLGGESEAQDDAFGSLGLAMGVSLILMYMLMVALFDSFVYPLVIMGALPLAVVGAIGALAITGDTLNIFSMIGMIMLMGLVAKNAILLVDYTNTLRKRGLTRPEALLEAGPTRLRPIVMTTASMVFAMMPVAWKFGEGAETRAPMGIVVIGGLLTSTLLTLLVVPAGYTIMDDFQLFVGKLFRRKPKAEVAAVAGQAGESAEGPAAGLGTKRTMQAEPVRVSVE